MYENTVFLENGNEELITWIIIMLLYPLLRLLSTIKNSKISQKSQKTLENYRYNVHHRIFIQIYLETGTAAFL